MAKCKKALLYVEVMHYNYGLSTTTHIHCHCFIAQCGLVIMINQSVDYSVKLLFGSLSPLMKL